VASSAFFVDFAGDNTGYILIFWSFIALERFWAIVKCHRSDIEPEVKPVQGILRGLSEEQEQYNREAIQGGLKTSLFVFFILNILFCMALIWSRSAFPMEEVVLIVLCSLVFWAVQVASYNAYLARKALVFLGGLVLIQAVMGNITLSLEDNFFLSLPEGMFGVVMIGFYAAAVFFHGLMSRHRHHVFPATGLLTLGVVAIIGHHFSAGLCVSMVAFFAVCFAQSFSTSTTRSYIFGSRGQLYS
jgi:hypothetical protein